MWATATAEPQDAGEPGNGGLSRVYYVCVPLARGAHGATDAAPATGGDHHAAGEGAAGPTTAVQRMCAAENATPAPAAGAAQLARAMALLAHGERVQVATLRAQGGPHAEARARGYALVRAACRLLVGAHTGLAPADVPLTRDARGVPQLGGACAAWSVSLSHGTHHVACALTRGARVGVDVEYAHRFADAPERALRLARRFFAPPETAAIESLAAQLQPVAFLTAWTVKEAVGKAYGVGLRHGPASIRLDLADACAALGARTQGSAGTPGAGAAHTRRVDPPDVLPGTSAPFAWVPVLAGGKGSVHALVMRWGETKAPLAKLALARYTPDGAAPASGFVASAQPEVVHRLACFDADSSR